MKIINDVSDALYQRICKDNEDAPKPDFYRVSELNGAPLVRQQLVEHWDDIELKASEFIFAMAGTAMHSILEKYEPPKGGFYKIEEDMKVKIGDVTVKGTADLIIGDTLEDYKFCGVYAATKRPISPNWVNQTNLYVLLAKRVFGVEIKNVNINAILRDWMMSKKFTKGYPKIPYMRIPIPVHETQDQLDYLNSRLKIHDYTARTGNAEPCTPEERWQKETTYAVMQENRKSAVVATVNGKSLYSYADAEQALRTDSRCKGKTGLRIEKRQGEDTYCKSYCPVRHLCPHNQETPE